MRGARAGRCAVAGVPAAHAADVVNVYNWGNSIGKATIANFEKATGIKVVYQEFDSNETLQAKLLSGTSGMTSSCRPTSSGAAAAGRHLP